MKRTIIFYILIILSSFLFAQPYGNEWIEDFTQQYFRIPVVQDGIYRISRQTLENAGVDFGGGIIPDNFQIFARGEEQYIYVKTAYSDLEYIEFFAEKNDGWLDSAVYDAPESQTNPNYSLFNDTASYFLTWNTSLDNRRMEVINPAIYDYTSPYCIKHIFTGYTSHYYSGPSNAEYTIAEGWFSSAFTSSITKNISTPEAYPGLNAEMEIAVVGANANSHHLQVNILGITYVNAYYNGYTTIKESFAIPTSALNNTINFDIIDDVGSVVDRNAIAYVSIKYPHTYNFENQSSFKFILPNNSEDTTLIKISDFDGGTTPVLYDITNHKRITVTKPGSVFRALIPNSTSERDCYISSEPAINNITQIEPVSFTDYSYLNADYIIITHPKLWNEANNYKTYRNLTGFNATVVNIEELYHQFAYGIKKHPLAIKNFVNYVINTWDSIPKYLFLLGKSIHARYYRKNAIQYENTLVPSFGYPSSDILLTAGLNGTDFQPAIPTGRLAAHSPDDVEIYLSKVIEYESNEAEEWMKNILHFGGGKDASEQNEIAGFLNTYEGIIEDTLFGGYVSTFLKNSSLPIEYTQCDSITALINNGTSIITFFGHGTYVGFDQEIDHPSVFNNQGKYPFILANSCFAGDIHQLSSLSISEEWILIADKGSIGYLATIGFSYKSKLHGYSTEWYKNIAHKNYGKSIGKCIQQTIETYQQGQLDNVQLTNTCLEFTLHGDPAIVINSHLLPDLAISHSKISFTPAYVTTEIDSFALNIIVTNIGRATTDTFIIEINRIYPDGSTETTYRSMAGCLFQNTLNVTLPVDIIKGVGLNQFSITVDAMGQITELREDNNYVFFISLIIHSSDLIPVYPYKYAIFPDSIVTLKASTSDPFVPLQNSMFEIDTTDTFDSPLLYTTISHTGGVVSWTPPLILTDSTVYYWRVSKDYIDPDDYNWRESSFIYIPGKTGWSQAHIFQFKNDDYNFINYNRSEPKFDFITTPKQIHCQNIGSAWGANQWYNVKYSIDASVQARSSCCARAAMLVAVIDSMTLEPWKSDIQDFGQTNYKYCWECNPTMMSPTNYFVFYSSDYWLPQRDSMAKMLQKVPNGNYILVYTFNNGCFNQWSPDIISAFTDLGATNIDTSLGNYPYIFFVKKGYPGTAHEEIGNSATDTIFLKDTLETNFNYGYVTSELIGAATYWKSLHWRQHSLETPTQDICKLKVTGITASGSEDVLIDNIPVETTDIYNLYDSIDSATYPYLKLNLFTQDDSLKTPSQLDRWQITYEGAPETAINPIRGYYFYKDTIDEGDNVIFSIATENISPYDMDSLLISYWLQDRDNNIHPLETKRLRPHPAGDVLIDTITFPTYDYPGLNSLWIEVNPVNPETGVYDQLEQYHFNNIAQIFFYVLSDKTNPILDVTFDGVHILDGDIVSAKPEILIKLNDENKFLALNDPSLFKVYLKSHNTGVEKKIDIDNDTLIWIPAQLPDNSCKLVYTPEFIEDGVYELRVWARDVSNNESGDIDYIISFEIITKSTITDIFNYPNPFSTSTRFVFTLTGSEIPTDFRIQILTITGKLVKVITLSELGNIHIGPNKTDYAWDGTDMYGDQLANGVYFYRVIISINGQSIEKRATGAEKYFHKGFGKMYLMR